jgi:hypothetical protein
MTIAVALMIAIAMLLFASVLGLHLRGVREQQTADVHGHVPRTANRRRRHRPF